MLISPAEASVEPLEVEPNPERVEVTTCVEASCAATVVWKVSVSGPGTMLTSDVRPMSREPAPAGAAARVRAPRRKGTRWRKVASMSDSSEQQPHEPGLRRRGRTAYRSIAPILRRRRGALPTVGLPIEIRGLFPQRPGLLRRRDAEHRRQQVPAARERAQRFGALAELQLSAHQCPVERFGKHVALDAASVSVGGIAPLSLRLERRAVAKDEMQEAARKLLAQRPPR